MDRLLRLLCLPLLCLLLAACGEDDERAAAKPTPTPAQTPADTGQAPAECKKVSEPEPKEDGNLSRPKTELDPAKTYVATVATSCGDFEITLDVKRAPKTAASFASLARKKFFAGTIFHRIVPGFVIQGGDPTGTGMGGPGYTVTEAPPEDLAYKKGVVAMAKAGNEPPGASGSQFYVVTGEDAGLPPEYALLGEVTKGIDVVDLIGASPTGPDERPVTPVVIESVTIAES